MECSRRIKGLLTAALGLALVASSLRADGPVDWTRLDAERCGPQMKVHLPGNLPSSAPLVVALHGCTQSAAEYAAQSGWSALADELGFAVIYPEQPSCANPWRCFNWFDPAHITRGQGEVKAIRQMIDTLRSEKDIDPERIYVAGFSAGAASAVAMLAAYPEVFAGGAVAAALPYRIADGSHDAMTSMLVGKDRTPEAWGDKVRQEHPGYQGSYPPLVIFHGTADRTVNPVNQRELLDQWTDLHQISREPQQVDSVSGHQRETFTDASGEARVVSYSFQGMGHALPVDPGNGPRQGGQTGQFAKDVNLFSSWYALDAWGLVPR